MTVRSIVDLLDAMRIIAVYIMRVSARAACA